MLAFGNRDGKDISIYGSVDILKMAVFWVVAPCSRADFWKTSTRLHGVTTQKTAIFILTAVRTSNLTVDILILVYRLYYLIFSVPIKKGLDN
jgi:hypothetical protein